MKSKLKNAKKYPKFIRESKVVGAYADQERVWPRLGLKNCSQKIVGKSNKRIVFTGSGERALWDIATMSMRGIRSCQSWDHRYSKALIGSMVDPYVGIIYITNGKKTKLGKTMDHRAVVRFVVDVSTKKPAILIENVYSRIAGSGAARYAFQRFIREKTKNKLPVICGDHRLVDITHIIPKTKATARLGWITRSYRDSRVAYCSVPKFNSVFKIEI